MPGKSHNRKIGYRELPLRILLIGPVSHSVPVCSLNSTAPAKVRGRYICWTHLVLQVPRLRSDMDVSGRKIGIF
jgi:hypothetical protein